VVEKQKERAIPVITTFSCHKKSVLELTQMVAWSWAQLEKGQGDERGVHAEIAVAVEGGGEARARCGEHGDHGVMLRSGQGMVGGRGDLLGLGDDDANELFPVGGGYDSSDGGTHQAGDDPGNGDKRLLVPHGAHLH
jgi:hypothetical protein